MTVKTAGKMPLRAAMGQLYGYIYCMLLSNMLVDLPLFGGALYLCGHAVMFFSSIYGKKKRSFLPSYARHWFILLFSVLLGMTVFLIGIYPIRFQTGNIWIMMGAAALCLLSDGMARRLTRMIRPEEEVPFRMKTACLLFQLVLIAGMTVLLVVSLGWVQSWPMIAGYAVMAVNRLYSTYRLQDSMEAEEEENGEESLVPLHAYQTMEWISLLLVMAVELTVTVLYALLATKQERLFPALVVAALCTLIPAETGTWLLRWTEKKGTKDPTWLLCTGLIFWLGGIVSGIWTHSAGSMNYVRVYVSLAICAIGGTLSLTGLGRMEELTAEALCATEKKLPAGYWKRRLINWELARLLGDVISLIVLCIICCYHGKNLPMTGEEIAARFQPLMVLPVLAVIIGALISALHFPLSQRYIKKIRRMLKLQEDGGENQALQRQIDRVVTEKYKQPYLTRFLIACFRLFYRFTLKHPERIVPDDNNPLVFLCNHGEIFGPIVCKLYIPVTVRSWTFEMMMGDRKKVTKYLYDNTFERQKWPLFMRKGVARLMGYLSSTVMNQIESIPVYRDSPLKLRETIRLSIEAMEAGDNLLIFPENTGEKYKLEGVGELLPGFVMLAEAYWRKTGQRMRFLPIYANKKERTLSFGKTIEYDGEKGFADEQKRIIDETLQQMNAMAENRDIDQEDA